jgi:ATP-dependent protease HslVU (ClpYQ) peptidase subunit
MKRFEVTFIVDGYAASNTQTVNAKDESNAREIVKESLQIMYKLGREDVEVISIKEIER